MSRNRPWSVRNQSLHGTSLHVPPGALLPTISHQKTPVIPHIPPNPTFLSRGCEKIPHSTFSFRDFVPSGNFQRLAAGFPPKTRMISNVSSNFHYQHFARLLPLASIPHFSGLLLRTPKYLISRISRFFTLFTHSSSKANSILSIEAFFSGTSLQLLTPPSGLSARRSPLTW
jgi:hypothetical protein